MADSFVSEWARENSRLLSRRLADKVHSIPLRDTLSKTAHRLNVVARNFSYRMKYLVTYVLPSKLFKNTRLISMEKKISWLDQLLVSVLLGSACVVIPLSHLYIKFKYSTTI